MLSCLYFLQGTENHSLKPSVCIVSIIAYTSLVMALPLSNLQDVTLITILSTLDSSQTLRIRVSNHCKTKLYIIVMISIEEISQWAALLVSKFMLLAFQILSNL